jgi:acylphosphatase
LLVIVFKKAFKIHLNLHDNIEGCQYVGLKMQMNITRAILKISGKVQGVFYRQSTKQKARQLGISGYVKNEKDGTVFVDAIGPLDKLDELIAWCQKGPPSASVKNVEVKYSEIGSKQVSNLFEIL